MLSLLFAGQLLVPAVAPPDSARIQREARAAQAAFERERRRLLPLTTAGLGRCDERVGRFCYWYDEAEPPPPPEPPRIAALRDRFLARLDSLVRLGARASWLAGQRVRYLVEAGHPDEALAVARDCGDGWRCAAMAGYALHAAQAFDGADSAFAVALAAMPSDLRCRWADLSLLLEPRDRGPYRRLTCEDRDSANATLLWRSAPLHAAGGHDLRTEIYARRALAVMLEGAVTHHGRTAGADYEEMLLRYGWATAYGRRHDPLGPVEEIDVVGHEPKPSFAFLAWVPGQHLSAAERPRFRYAPRYVSQLEDFDEVQVARFRRGDSLVLAVACAVSGDSVFHADGARGRVVVSGEHGEWRAVGTLDGRFGATLIPVHAGGGFVSVELSDSGHRAWRRHRDLIGGIPEGISDLLVVRPDSGGVTSLEAAAPGAGGRLEFRVGEPVGLYWEDYPRTTNDEPAPIRLTVAPVGEGALRRFGRALGIGADRQQIELEWVPGAPDDTGVRRHSLELDLSRLVPGRYLVQVRTWSPDGAPLLAGREIRLR